jgi:DNA-binding transcriptional regulator YiaG
VVELADVLGVSRHLLHSWESGRREPRAGACEKYAAALQTLRGGGEINQ